MPERVADHLVRAVAALGARHVFGVGGANIEDLYDAVYEAGAVRGVVAKHEFAAAAMADGAARATAGIGVVAATSGGGAMNLVPGLAESYASRVPVLALIGQPATAGRGAFQDTSGVGGTIDAERLFGGVTGYCARVRTGAELPAHLDAAAAALHRALPAALLLPKDVQQERIALPAWTPPAATPRPDDAALDEVRALLAGAAGRVVVLAGSQVGADDARAELARLVTVLGAEVGVAPDAKDVYAGPGFRGVCGVMGHPGLVAAVESAACCLLAGTPLPGPALAGLEGALAALPVVSVGHTAPHVGAVHAPADDLRAALATLADALTPASSPRAGSPGGSRSAGDTEPIPGARTRLERDTGPRREARTASRVRLEPDTTDGRGTYPDLLPVPPHTGPGLRYRTVIDALSAALPPGANVVADAGNTGAAVVHHLRVPPGGRFTVALGMGGMGYAFGAGIGACLARGGRTVVVAGDGAFYMHGAEFHTAVQYDLPLTVVVLDNSAHAMCVTREQLYYADRYSYNRFRPVELGAGTAALFPGVPVWTVRTAAELGAALPAALAAPGPSFVAVTCDPDEIPPFLPFLTPRSTP